MKCALEIGNDPLFYRARKVSGKSTGALQNAIPGPVKFPVNRPGKLSGPVVTGSFEKRGPRYLF